MKKFVLLAAAIGTFALFGCLIGAPWFVTAIEIVCIAGILYISWPEEG